MKTKRQNLILKLIEKYIISTQDELLQKLKDNGFEATQATVSRDIKELRLVKVLGPNGVYARRNEPIPTNSFQINVLPVRYPL